MLIGGEEQDGRTYRSRDIRGYDLRDFQTRRLSLSISRHLITLDKSIMSPSATIPVDSYAPPHKDESTTKSRNTESLKKSGALEAAFEFEDVTPTIGREITAQIVEDILNVPNVDDLLRDLAITSKLPPFSEEPSIDP